jgi:hypothetical protein
MKGFLGRVALERVFGSRPSSVRALAASAVVGFAATGVTYKLLRDGFDSGSN